MSNLYQNFAECTPRARSRCHKLARDCLLEQHTIKTRRGISRRLKFINIVSLSYLVFPLCVALGLPLYALPAFAKCTTTGGCPLTPGPTGGTCLQDEYTVQTGSTKTLGCTAGDVKIAKAQNPRGLDGTPITQCVQGSTFSFIADFFVQTTSTSSRSNIGLYMNTKDEAGGALAPGDTCADNIISPVHAPDSNLTPFPPDNGPACFSGSGQTPQCLGSPNY